MAKVEMVNKVTLSTGKTVLLREQKIKHQELAAKAVGNRAGDNVMLNNIMLQNELLKILIAGIDDKPVSGAALEDLDANFSNAEYRQLLKAVEKIEAGETPDPKIEVVTSGAK